jgi:hypothetical protein
MRITLSVLCVAYVKARHTEIGLQVSWLPPTKNADQIERYKLMMASSPGAVREVAQGTMLKQFVGGLRTSTEYIFCVKAIYQDGSFLWSESKAFRTAAR